MTWKKHDPIKLIRLIGSRFLQCSNSIEKIVNHFCVVSFNLQARNSNVSDLCIDVYQWPDEINAYASLIGAVNKFSNIAWTRSRLIECVCPMTIIIIGRCFYSIVAYFINQSANFNLFKKNSSFQIHCRFCRKIVFKSFLLSISESDMRVWVNRFALTNSVR